MSLNKDCDSKGSETYTNANSCASLRNIVPPPGETEDFTPSCSVHKLTLVS